MVIYRGIIAPLKEKIAEAKLQIIAFFMLFSPANISEMIAKAKTMTPIELFLALFTGMFWTLYGFGYFIIRTVAFMYNILVSLMRGSEKEPVKKVDESETKKKAPIGE